MIHWKFAFRDETGNVNEPIVEQIWRVCDDPMPWLISFSLDYKPTNQEPMKKPVMRSARVPILFCLMVFRTNPLSAFADPANQPSKVAKPTPLILEKNDGERRAWRDILGLRRQPEMRFILKVDHQNGGSSHLVFGTEDMAPGAKSTCTNTQAQMRSFFWRMAQPG